MRNLVLGIILSVVSLFIYSEKTQRVRPKEWSDLVCGGRFVDRFLPMPNGVKKEVIWGTDSVKNRFVDNGIELPNMSFWGGNIMQTSDGKYHLFVCGWPENSPKGHMFWPNSTVFHTISDCMSGPYVIRDIIGKGHNPEVFRLKDGRVIIYVIGGYYTSELGEGPWEFKKFQFDRRDRKIIEGLSNLTFAKREDGSYLMICRGGGVWVSQTGESPYMQLTDKRIYPAAKGNFEDPVVWKDHIQYHLIVNDWYGRIAYYQRSKDGVHWITEPGEAYVPGVSYHKNGEVEYWYKYERPKVFQDKYGRAIQMNFAVIDTIKKQDLPNDNHNSKNICIPLNKGLLLSVNNKTPINAKTDRIEVVIHAEEDFNPQKEIDAKSLRFGSYLEVNFGRGSRVLTTKKLGRDLVVVFDGKNSGISSDEFAPKLIGRNKKGEMLFGYARLAYLDYQPAIISARRPIYNKSKNVLMVEVSNLGLSTSSVIEMRVISNRNILSSINLKPLKPYQKVQLSLDVANHSLSEELHYEVVFLINGKEIDRNYFN